MCVVDMTDASAVPGEIKDPGESGSGSGGGEDWRESMSSAGLGKVLNVEPREVYLLVFGV